MTVDEFEIRVQKLIEECREAGMTDASMAAVFEDAAEELHERDP